MGKVSVVAKVRSYLKNYFDTGSQHDFEERCDHLAEACIKAAKKILRLYEDVRRTGNLTRFSFTDFQGCSVATSLVLLAGILERDSDYERHVNFGLDSLRKMAEGNATAKAGLKFVEALQSVAEEALQKLHEHGAVTTNATFTQDFRQTADYGTWADWLAHQPRQANSMVRSGTQTPFDLGGSSIVSEDESPMEFATWNGAAALQQLSSVPSLMPPSGGLHDEINAGSADMFDTAICTTNYSEDPMFLMGLTGFDMMGFRLHD
ncbi:hypothetical protein N0V86_008985 [Didymella sp. IMI 355093]|nr:hypothetical protein N0V86_008985 [Didymella sp. IMI 355093]